MYFSSSKDNANVYFVDTDEMIIEMWNWHGEPELLKTEKLTGQQMAEGLCTMLANGWVKRSSDELVG